MNWHSPNVGVFGKIAFQVEWRWDPEELRLLQVSIHADFLGGKFFRGQELGCSYCQYHLKSETMNNQFIEEWIETELFQSNTCRDKRKNEGIIVGSICQSKNPVQVFCTAKQTKVCILYYFACFQPCAILEIDRIPRVTFWLTIFEMLFQRRPVQCAAFSTVPHLHFLFVL